MVAPVAPGARRLSSEEIPGLPFALEHERLEPGAQAGLQGPRRRILLVLDGHGTLSVPGAPAQELSAGAAVPVPEGGEAAVACGGDGALEYVSVSWPDEAAAAGPAARGFDRDAMYWAYEMHLQDLYSAAEIPGLPFGSVFGSVPAGATSKLHRHQDGEIFVVLGGRAEVLVQDEARELGRGEMIFLPPFRTHGIRNLSAEPFDLVSLYWEDIEAAGAALADPGTRREPRRTLVFCPPVTPNGGLHLGHLSGPYLRADLYSRALRGAGAQTLLITGTDDHQSFVATAAHRLGTDPREVAAKAGAQITATLEAVEADAAHVCRPSADADLAAEVRRLFADLAASPAVSTAHIETPWCEHCDQSLFQAYAHGRCPHCDAASDGEICEACGTPGTAADLLDLRCTQCGAVPGRRTEQTLVLDLAGFSGPLRRYLGQVPGAGGARKLASDLVEAGLADYRLTRRSRWGMPVRTQEPADETIDAWVELALTQIAHTVGLAGRDGADNLTVLGFDNTYFYLVLLPAVCLALGMPEALPQGFVCNRFLHLEGEKFSTSRRHVVWADDLLAELPADLVRLALLRRSPEERVRSVGAAEIKGFGDDPLIGRLERWIEALGELPGEGRVPGTGAWSEYHTAFYRGLCAFSEDLERLVTPDCFSSVAYVEKIEALLPELFRFHTVEIARRAISGAQEEARTSVALEYLATKVLAAALDPVTPTLGSALWRALGLSGEPRREQYWSFIPGGTDTALAAVPLSQMVRPATAAKQS